MSDRQVVPNRHLAAVMQLAGASNKGLARRVRELSDRDGGAPVQADHVQVARWLNGSIRQPHPRTCRLIARALAEKLGRPVKLAEIGYTDVRSDGYRGLEYPIDLAASVDALGQLTHDELNQTTASPLEVVPEAWSTLLLRWLMDGDGEPPRLPLSGPWPVGEWDVEAIRDARSMFANYDYKFGGGRPKPLIAKFLDSEVLPRLSRVSPTDPVGREYFREVAALTRLAGWTAYDTGSHGLAQCYMTQAFRFAKAAGDKALCGRVLAGMSHQANFLGHYQRAADLAQAAYQRAGGYATPTAMALFHAMEARALASLGNEAGVTGALIAAENWHNQSEPTDDPDWIQYFDSAELHAEFAHCFRDLGKPQLAAEHAATSIRESKTLYVRSLCFCRTVLATSHLQSADLDQALTVARGVIHTAVQLKSSRVMSYVDDFWRRLSTARGNDPQVRQFHEYVRHHLSLSGMPASGCIIVV